MLDAWVIEKNKDDKKEKDNRPQIKLPVPEDFPCEVPKKPVQYDGNKRGVLVIQTGYDDEKEN